MYKYEILIFEWLELFSKFYYKSKGQKLYCDYIIYNGFIEIKEVRRLVVSVRKWYLIIVIRGKENSGIFSLRYIGIE